MAASGIKAFTIDIPNSKLARLRSKLAVFNLPTEVQDDAWSRGPPVADILRLAEYWRDGFDWRAVEKKMNDDLPQFMTRIDVDGFGDFDVHFVHKQSETREAIPLLFVHGWPGSFVEVRKILPLLVGGGHGGEKEVPKFHVVAPSLVISGSRVDVPK